MSASRIGFTLLLPVFAVAAVSALGVEGGHAQPQASAGSVSVKGVSAEGVRVYRDAAVSAAPAAAPVVAAPSAPAAWSQRAILDAIRFVESSNRLHPPDGDGGRALGPYQIRVAYWRDALAEDPSLATIRENGRSRPARHDDCRKLAYAEDVVRAYMCRHAADAWRSGQAEILARVHNGGPQGPVRASSAAYWGRVQTTMTSARRR